MSFLFAAPEALATAASDLAGIGSTLSTANAAASVPTSAVVASAADDVSAQVAAFLSEHGLGYQQVSAQIAKFHEQFVQTLTSGANAYAAAESSAAQTLAGAGGGIAGAAGGAVSSAVSSAANQVESVLGTFGGGVQAVAGQAAALFGTTSGIRALTAAGALLAPAAMTNAAAVTAANAFTPIGAAIESAYLAIEPWVQYGFELASYAAGWVPWIGWILGPQIMFFYNLFEPMVQSGLFNILDWLGGSITFAQGLNNFAAATSASINYFIQTEINWFLGFLPPLPPIGVNAP
ncbi:PE family protein [Mycobacterium alsense]|uniref:PE family protein n=1 Tax=Mycobacterium alsense TaxID=324058 RepID=A0AA41XL42_9MYCO|nr:PE family protein [Mycobacterium alsense]MCV7377477.1 PE family protein [Mycobacterium alsense]OQZ88831.1 PE family protein [Mycobacterium alsense]